MSLWKECHPATNRVFKDPKSGIEFHAGGRSHGFSPQSGWLVFNLSGDNSPWPVALEMSRMVPFLGKYAATNIQTIHVRWPDGGTPNLPDAAWHDFVRAIRTLRKPVGVCCVAGHGRTGTFLSIMAALTGACPVGDPVAFVRQWHCKKAVETTAQIALIERVTGRKVAVSPSHGTTANPGKYFGKAGGNREGAWGGGVGSLFGKPDRPITPDPTGFDDDDLDTAKDDTEGN